MKIDCIYFDDPMTLIQEVKLTMEQLKDKEVYFEDFAYGFIFKGRNLGSLPNSWDLIIENNKYLDIRWREFIFDGTLFLIGMVYNLRN